MEKFLLTIIITLLFFNSSTAQEKQQAGSFNLFEKNITLLLIAHEPIIHYPIVLLLKIR